MGRAPGQNAKGRQPMIESFRSPVSIFFLGVPEELKKHPTFIEVPEQKIMISWSIDMEMREYGIKSISMLIPDQEVWILIEDENGNQKEIKVLIVNCSANIQDTQTTIYPKKLLYNQNKKEWFLTF